ncbi:MAG TPA: hypothetical protein VFL91_04740 [Thermomicrobiales bacterium]|nr:hypothetical protein [Thermomicrobiales bacterium]
MVAKIGATAKSPSGKTIGIGWMACPASFARLSTVREHLAVRGRDGWVRCGGVQSGAGLRRRSTR